MCTQRFSGQCWPAKYVTWFFRSSQSYTHCPWPGKIKTTQLRPCPMGAQKLRPATSRVSPSLHPLRFGKRGMDSAHGDVTIPMSTLLFSKGIIKTDPPTWVYIGTRVRNSPFRPKWNVNTYPPPNLDSIPWIQIKWLIPEHFEHISPRKITLFMVMELYRKIIDYK